MPDLSPESLALHQPEPGRHASPIKVYGRLLRYAWAYKGRLLVSLLFALVIAASFSSILVGIGGIVDLTFYTAEYTADGQLKHADPLDRYAARIAAATGGIERATGWAPPPIDARFRDGVAAMRANRMAALTVVCVIAVTLAGIIGIARFLQEYFAGTIGANISADLAEEMYANLMRQSVGFFEARGSGDILARFTNDIFMVNRGLSGVFVKLMREPFKALGFLAVAVYTDPLLTLIGLGVLPPVGFSLGKLGKRVRNSTRRSLQKIAAMASVVNESISGIAIIKGYTMEAYEVSRVRAEVTRLRRFLRKMVKADAATEPITEFILVLGLVAFIMLSGQRVAHGSLAYGDLITLISAILLMLDPVRKLSSVNNLIQISVASGERVFELIDAQPDITEAPNAVALPPLRDAIRFQGVRFAYDGGPDIIDGIDLEIRKGEMIALVGFSGAGKSTLVKLLPRFYDVTAGRILFDGVDIRGASFKSLRAQIGLVTQHTILFAESIRANIAFGQAQYSGERVRDAARAANAAEFIDRLPKGYDTILAEGGASLSGGQRQRLAIARAIIKDPAILILDEATSSLDSESERLIQDALDHFVAGRTAIVIAHRLSTVQRADRIVVLDQGRIAETGTHAQLLAHDGIYKRLYETQFGAQPAV